MPLRVTESSTDGAGGRKERGDKKQARKARRDARRPAEAAPAPLPTVHELEIVNARPVGTQRTWVRSKETG